MPSRIGLLAAFGLLVAGQSSFAADCQAPQMVAEAAPEPVRTFFRGTGAKVVTFVGYSGAGYEDPASALSHAARVLEALDPKTTLINIGATADGIGAVYELAKRRGFTTAGIVSAQARHQSIALSPCVDLVFYVPDETWGGQLPGSATLSPTSDAIVSVSDAVIAIGGGEVARDELLAARRLGKPVDFIPADMNHRIAEQKAAAKKLPPPTDFRGAAHAAWLPGS